MSLLKVVVLSVISAVVCLFVLFNSLKDVDVVNVSSTQQAAISAVYDASK